MRKRKMEGSQHFLYAYKEILLLSLKTQSIRQNLFKNIQEVPSEYQTSTSSLFPLLYQLKLASVIIDSVISAVFQISMKGQDKIVVSKLKKITIISGIFMLVELAGGYTAHSIAIFADAFHLLSDVLAYVISLLAVLMSYRASPKGLTFGYQKLQPLGALVNVGIIWFVTAELFMEATQRLLRGSIVEEPKYMLLTSFVGLGCNLFIMNVLHSDEIAGGHHNCSHNHGAIHAEEHHHDKHGSCGHNHGSAPKVEKHEHGAGCSHDHHAHDHNHQHHQHKHDEHEHPHQSCRHLPQTNHEHQHHQGCSHSHIQANSTQQTSARMSDQIRSHTPASDQQIKIKSSPSVDDRFQNNINIKAAYIHILTDIILSIGVIISASIIYFFAPEGHVWSYWQIADPLCTYLFSVMAIYTTIPIVKESLNYLLDGCDNVQIIYEIEEELRDNSCVDKVQSLKVWSVSRGKYYGALRVKVKEGSRRTLNHIFSSRNIQGYVQIVENEVDLAEE